MSGKPFDGIAAADHSASHNAAQHTATAPKLFQKPGPNRLHLVTGGAYSADLQTYFADPQELADLQAIHIQAIGSDVLADNPWLETHGLQSFAIHQQNLALASPSSMSTAFKAPITHCMNFG